MTCHRWSQNLVQLSNIQSFSSSSDTRLSLSLISPRNASTGMPLSVPHLANINLSVVVIFIIMIYRSQRVSEEACGKWRSSALLSFGRAGLAALLTVEFVITNTMLRHQMTPAEKVDARLVFCYWEDTWWLLFILSLKNNSVHTSVFVSTVYSK